jgi:hypothetical protein
MGRVVVPVSFRSRGGYRCLTPRTDRYAPRRSFLLGELDEPALDKVQPRARGCREVRVKARVGGDFRRRRLTNPRLTQACSRHAMRRTRRCSRQCLPRDGSKRNPAALMDLSNARPSFLLLRGSSTDVRRRRGRRGRHSEQCWRLRPRDIRLDPCRTVAAGWRWLQVPIDTAVSDGFGTRPWAVR